MAIALNIIHLGLSPFVTQAIQGDVNNSILPTGTTLGTALALGSAINDIATTPTNTGVSIPANAVTLGDEVFVYNGAASNALKVYPALSTESINTGGAGAAFSVAAGKSATFTRTQNLIWRAVLSS